MTSNLATGIIRAHPKDSTTWWMILDCGLGWSLLYEHWMQKQAGGRWVRDRHGKLQYQNARLQRPLWGNHISMIRGEEPRQNEAAWDHLDGRVVEFRFNPDLGFNQSGDRVYWWLDVECSEIGDLRESFGLDRDPEFPLHLTLGTIS